MYSLVVLYIVEWMLTQLIWKFGVLTITIVIKFLILSFILKSRYSKPQQWKSNIL